MMLQTRKWIPIGGSSSPLFCVQLLLLLLLAALASHSVCSSASLPLQNVEGDQSAANYPFSTEVYDVPFIVIHGLGDQCSNAGLSRFVDILVNITGQNGTCIEIGDGAADSWAMSMDEQMKSICRQVKGMPHLSKGFNLLGLSQGALIGRGYVEFCEDAPPVYNLISLGGPQAGVSSTPRCLVPLVCHLIDLFLQWGVYTNYVQDNVGPAGYLKIPTDLSGYYSGCKFLPKLNNEIAGQRNSTYKNRFLSLKQLVLVMFEEDTVMVPKESALFAFHPGSDYTTVEPMADTPLYQEDWIGLRQMDEEGRVVLGSTVGEHLHVTAELVKEYVLPYLSPKDGAYSDSLTPISSTKRSRSSEGVSYGLRRLRGLRGWSVVNKMAQILSLLF